MLKWMLWHDFQCHLHSKNCLEAWTSLPSESSSVKRWTIPTTKLLHPQVFLLFATMRLWKNHAHAMLRQWHPSQWRHRYLPRAAFRCKSPHVGILPLRYIYFRAHFPGTVCEWTCVIQNPQVKSQREYSAKYMSNPRFQNLGPLPIVTHLPQSQLGRSPAYGRWKIWAFPIPQRLVGTDFYDPTSHVCDNPLTILTANST